MKWTLEKPKQPGNYWYKRDEETIPGLTGKPRILYVNTNLCVPQLNLYDYKEPVSIKEYKGLWAGPIIEPEEEIHDMASHLYESAQKRQAQGAFEQKVTVLRPICDMKP